MPSLGMRKADWRRLLALRKASNAVLEQRTRGLQPWFGVERLENRRLLSVSIINGGGSGYVGNGGGGPPDVTGAAGPNSYLEIDNTAVTLFSPKPGGTILAQDGIGDFFYNPAIGNETKIYNPTVNIAASSTGATESGTTATITTATPHGFVVGQSVSISGVGVAGYNGGVKITGTPTATTFTYTAGTSGLGNSGGGTVSGSSCGVCDSTGVFDNLMGANGRFIIGDIDVETSQNVGQYIFAVSKSSNPTTFTTADWNFYHITTTEGSGGPSSTSWSDYPGNPGFNADAYVETFNMFGGGPNGTQVISVNASDLASGVSQGSLHFFKNDVPGGAQNYRPVTMQDSVTGDPMWLVHDHGDGSNIDVVKMTSVLSNSASFTATSLALPAADDFNESGIGNPLNPDDTAAIDGDDDSGIGIENPGGSGSFDPGNRILKAGEYNNTIVAAHAVAVAGGTNTLASAQANDKNGNPLGGSGYTVGDILTVNFGTFTTAATLKVTGVGAGGIVTTVSVVNPGSYSSLSGIDGSASGGTGTGAFFSLFFTGQLVAQWYAFDVSGGTPAFQIVGGSPNVGRMSFGPNTYSFEPAIDINSSGEIGLGFMESDTVGGAINTATGGFISTFVTAREPGDPAGTMDPPVLVPTGTGTAAINGRTGDFSGMSVDPQNGTFWHVNEFGGGGPTDIANFTPEAAPTVTPPSDQTAVEGAPKSINLGSFTDPDGSPWTVKVDWGDGSQNSFSVATAGSLGSLTHTYVEEGNYTPKVTVTDSTLLSDSVTFNIAVSDPAVIPTGGFLITGVEGADAGTQTVATFTDPGGAEVLGDYSATIKWGDGNITSGAITFSGGVFTVRGADTYGEEGLYTITITLHHETAPDAVTTSTANISDPAVVGTGTAVTAIACLPLTGVTVANFTDPGGAEPNPSDPSGTINDHYKIMSINWGDGTPLDTSSGVLSFGGAAGSKTDSFTVSGSHTYATEGVYTITVVLAHESAPKTTVTSSITVRDNIGLLTLDPSGSGALTVSGNGGVVVNNCGAVVVDSSNPAAAVLDGNGTVSAMDIDVTGGTVINGNGAFIGGPVMHEPPMADIVGLPLPAAPAPTFPAVKYTGSATLTLSPGTYVGGITISGQASVVLLPGVYYLQGGGLKVSGQGSLTGAGVLIINSPGSPNDGISFTGQGNISLSAPPSSALPATYSAYAGITIFQNPASTAPVVISGNGGVTMDGILYAPHAALYMSGNGGLTDSTDPTAPVAAVIVYDAILSGNGVLTINADAAASNPSVTPLPGAAKAIFTSFTTSANPSVRGQPITLTAIMSANPASASPPAGLVDFFDETTHLDLGSVTLAGGVASVTASLTSLGGHVIIANYLASSPNYAAPAPDPLTEQVQSEAIESGALFVGGSSGNEVQVQLKSGNVVVDVHDGSAKFQTPLAGLSAMVVYAQGSAQIQVDSGLTLPAFLFAGDGNGARIQAGGGPTVEVGGAGAGDLLQGGSGRTILIGGAGASSLQAGSGGTILIGGTTDYDNNLAVLQTALTTWNSATPYSARLAALGGIFSAATVHNNGLVDRLRGGGGTSPLDWFFASALDQITGSNPGDVVTPLV